VPKNINSSTATDPETYSTIFRLLSCHRIQDAVKVAESTGHYRLALLLSQINTNDTFTLLMDKQLSQWIVYDANKTMSTEIITIYRLLAGLVLDCYDEYSSLLRDMPWTQSLSLLFWYSLGSLSTLSDTLIVYKEAMEMDQTPLPIIVSTKTSNGSSTNVLFSLLQVLFEDSSEDNLIQLLHPQGYTKDVLDYRLAFTSTLLLQCLNKLPTNGSAGSLTLNNLARQHAIYYLYQVGEWKWALYLILQQPDENMRINQAKDTLLRFISSVPKEELVETRFFLEGNLSIPPQWIDEALGHSSCTSNLSINERVLYYIDGGYWELACELVCYDLAAQWIFSSTGSLKPLQDLLQLIEAHIDTDNSTWRKCGSVLIEYLRYIDHYNGAVHATDRTDTTLTAIEELLIRANHLLVKLNSIRLDRYTYSGQEPSKGVVARDAMCNDIALVVVKLERVFSELSSMNRSSSSTGGGNLFEGMSLSSSVRMKGVCSQANVILYETCASFNQDNYIASAAMEESEEEEEEVLTDIGRTGVELAMG
jgi:Nuclear protein 96